MTSFNRTNYIRYSVATVCFAASVGCLLLWWRSYSISYRAEGPNYAAPDFSVVLEAYYGRGIALLGVSNDIPLQIWSLRSTADDRRLKQMRDIFTNSHSFALLPTGGKASLSFHFPLWYPALIFALAGVASLRLGRRFTLRSALIATTVVAGLLGMAVIL